MAIILENITKKYGNESVLKNINARIEDSGVTGIFGPSGCGKTTLLRIITGLEKADDGKISLTRDEKFSIMFQEDRLLSTLNCIENTSVTAGREKAKQILIRLGLGEDMEKYPSEMSGGMCRRTAFARALAFDADVLVLDEPFKGVESEMRDIMIEMIREYAESKPVILITHDEAAKSLAENIIAL